MKFMVLTLFIIFSCTNWVIMWVGMEIMTFFFISLYMMKKNFFLIKHFSWKYFLIQSISSALMFLSFVMLKGLSLIFSLSFLSCFLMTLGMMIKLGMPPFHSWMFKICENMEWDMFFLFNTIQKISPMITLMTYESFMKFVMYFVIFSSIFSILCMWEYSIRRFILFSSILNTNWMLMCMMASKFVFLEYLVFYTFSMLCLCKLLESTFSEEVTYSWISSFWANKFMTMLCILTICGLPPFLGFFIKVELINYMISMNFLLVFMNMMSSTLMMYMYLHMSMSMVSMLKASNDYLKKMKKIMIIIIFSQIVWIFMYV
uniref:NADH-ubiquinone oxidoreductase chain 2 n=1 Tax=Ibidoecus bisignatus TaxID=236520 RepID=G1EN85_9NEOP|nr:NADH dehydrogenase subunit 2 [Ibidoecus bisignatus]AEM23868.1 NADH dehydrogenase subunit 2 [Ibidoecus bisignatus]